MSGGIMKHLNPISNIKSALKAKNLKQFMKSSFVDPLGAGDKLKKIGGDIMGTRAARQQAQAQMDATAAQTAQYQEQLKASQAQNQLDSQGDLGNVATVTSGGTAQASDDSLTSSTRKNRKQLISNTLGLG